MPTNEPDVPEYGPPVADPAALAGAGAGARAVAPHVRERVLRSANWFFWIAAFSLVNSVASHAGGHWHFIIGLGITAFADAVAGHFGGSGIAIVALFDIFAASIFAGFGLMARRMLLWPFLVGMAAYALDGGLLLVAGDFLSAAFHAYALYCIWLGVKALREWRSEAPAILGGS